MTNKALAARLRKLAQAYRSVVVVDATSINEATDLDRAADLIEQMAQPPNLIPAHIRDIERAIHDAENPKGMSIHDGMAKIHSSLLRRLLAIARAPAREPLTDEQIRALVQPMDWPPSVTEIVRAVEQVHGIKGGRNDS